MPARMEDVPADAGGVRSDSENLKESHHRDVATWRADKDRKAARGRNGYGPFRVTQGNARGYVGNVGNVRENHRGGSGTRMEPRERT